MLWKYSKSDWFQTPPTPLNLCKQNNEVFFFNCSITVELIRTVVLHVQYMYANVFPADIIISVAVQGCTTYPRPYMYSFPIV
jgi:hypothetical protein